jgi:hypothetical protein
MSKITKAERAGRVAQMEECLPNKYKVPVQTKNENKKK